MKINFQNFNRILLLAGSLIINSCASMVAPGPLLTVKQEVSLQSTFPRISGWNTQKLESARIFGDSLGTTAVIAIQNSQIVAEWGITDLVSSTHSIRKSIVSALFGIAIEKGLIDISLTLEELDIDDLNPPLSSIEKTARIEDLLASRSGIYHPSVKGDPLPPPGTHKPGEEFFYNNWSFNALGGIFEKLTMLKLGIAFKEWIADPIGMQDFKADDVIYFNGKESVFPAYRIWLSTRDLARFGVLFLQMGNWNGQQIIPADWIKVSTAKHSEVGYFDYGYCWWTTDDGMYLASGTGGQKLLIDPNRNLVVVNKVNSFKGIKRGLFMSHGRMVNNPQFLELVNRIMLASPESQ